MRFAVLLSAAAAAAWITRGCCDAFFFYRTDGLLTVLGHQPTNLSLASSCLSPSLSSLSACWPPSLPPSLLLLVSVALPPAARGTADIKVCRCRRRLLFAASAAVALVAMLSRPHSLTHNHHAIHRPKATHSPTHHQNQPSLAPSLPKTVLLPPAATGALQMLLHARMGEKKKKLRTNFN